jgi:demethylmenaquinone methyltransferase/2-methoxy-6-polyprenyl-1,4-benzoquinol methylase
MDDHARRVRRMFDAVAPRYDFLNHLLSLNQDRRWRRVAARRGLVGLARPVVLDLCAGTGDLALELARVRCDAQIVALDFVAPMLARARSKIAAVGAAGRIAVACGDALRLPFGDNHFDLLTIAFGLRNLAPVDSALREMARVLRPGGRLVILEFALPEGGVWGRVYGFYLFRVLPLIGNWISGTSAYSYLPASVDRFPAPRPLQKVIEEAGFVEAQWQPLAGGVLAVHTAERKALNAN